MHVPCMHLHHPSPQAGLGEAALRVGDVLDVTTCQSVHDGVADEVSTSGVPVMPCHGML